MKHINFIIGALLLLTFTICCAERLKPSGKWIPRNGYVFTPAHKVPLDAAKKWIEKEKISTRNDFEYSIIEINNNYEVFVIYIIAYSEKNEPLSAPGHHVTLVVSKKGKILQRLYGQ
jgi:hypothetical protein